jgi:hypothetical protein
VANDDERIALFLDYENLAIGARDGLGVAPFDFGPVADALAERGRVVARRAYADWSSFGEDHRLLTRAQVELIEIPQRVGGSRKNAADIKMAVDAIELAYERPFLTTFPFWAAISEAGVVAGPAARLGSCLTRPVGSHHEGDPPGRPA